MPTLRSVALSAALGLTAILGAAAAPAAAEITGPREAIVTGVASAPAAAEGCITGYVPREANASDRVCVTPATRMQTATDNSQAAARRDPSSATGCIETFVQREAFFGDTTCVTPATKVQAKYDNSQAPTRVAR